ncbi:MAG: bifunctional precorrin-2 dehydrogenase/sirohydrochlorin ferrochelatase, partial [Deltaproteobacteria bacterium]|nr:bifunctional precorrin-2 dehydrogenase/sirohydrochlorin ferrochelatase [Deltaproteobacteria bacterium]
TDDQAVNRAVSAAAEEAGLWANVTDQPQLCSFTLPALFRRGELLVTVSTGGASPLVAARLKEELAAQFGQAWKPYLNLLKALRAAVLAQDRPPEENRALFEAAVEADLLSPLGQGDWTEVGRRLKEACGLDLKDLEGPFE